MTLTGSGNYSYSGYLRDVTGKLAIVVDMAPGGSQTLSGGNISYTGGTTLNSGTLIFAGANKGIGGGMTLNGGVLNQTGTGYATVGGGLNVAVDSAVNVTNNGSNNQLFFDGGITGAGNLTITNTGTATTGVNFRSGGDGSYTGALTVVGGQLGISNGAGLALANSNVTLTGATLNLTAIFGNTATNATVGSLAGNASSSVTLGAKTLTFGGVGAPADFAGVIGGTGSLVKNGAGTQTLSGANTYSGTTTVNAGTLVLSGSFTGSGGTTVNAGGTLTLDYSANNTSKLANAGVLTLAGGTVNLTGGSHTEDVASTTLNAGLTQVVRTSGSSVLNLGAITVNAGAAINFSAAGIAKTTRTNDASGILGAWATIGSDFAYKDGSGLIQAYAGYTNISRLGGVIGTGAPATDITKNLKIVEAGASGNITLSGGNAVANTLTNAAGGGVATIDVTGANTLQLGASGGILMGATGAGLVIGTTANTGNLTAGTNTANSTGTLTITNHNLAGDITLNSTIINHGSGAVSLAKAGAGKLIVNGTNTYTGATTVLAGTLQVGDASALGVNSAVSVHGGTLDVNGQGLAIGSLAGTGAAATVTNGNASAAMLTTGGDGTSTTYAGVIQDGVGQLGLTKTGAGIQTLAGNNTYTGATTISAGTLQIGNAGTTGSLGSGTVTNNATLTFNRTDAYTVANDIGGTGVIRMANTGTMTLTGAIASTQELIFNHVNGTVILDKAGGNTVGNVTIGTNGNYGGRGTLILGASDQIADTSIVSLGAGYFSGSSSVSLNGFNETIGGLQASTFNTAGGNTMIVRNNAAGASILTLDVAGASSYSYGGNGNIRVMDGSTGTLSLVKAGTGTQVFDTTTLTYTGTTSVNAGTLSIRNSNFNTSATTVAGGTLDFQGATVNTTLDGTSGSVTITGGTTTTFGGGAVKTYTVDTQISGNSTLSQGAANSYNAASRHDVAAGSTLSTGNFSGTIGSLTGAGQVALAGTAATTLGVGGDNTSDAVFTGQISGVGSLAKVGSGTQTLADLDGAGQNDYSGATIVSDGTLRIGNNTAGAGNLGTGTVTVTGPGTLAFNRSDTPTVSNLIDGTGNVAQIGSGTTTLAGANTYSGTTTVSAGTLKAGVATAGGESPSSGAFGVNSALTVDAPATVDLNGLNQSVGSLSGAGLVTSSSAASRTLIVGTGGGDGSFAGVLEDGAGGTTGLTKTGAGTQTLTGTNTYTGTTAVGGGTLHLDFSAGGAPLSDIVSASSSLTMNGGTLLITGLNGATNTQSFNNTTIAAGSTIQLAQNGATSLDVNVGAITALSGGINFVGGTGETVGARFITTTSLAVNDGTIRLGASTWNGTNFASVKDDGFGNLYVVNWTGVITTVYTGTDDGTDTGTDGHTVIIPNAGAAAITLAEGGNFGGTQVNKLAAASTTVDALTMQATVTASVVAMNTFGGDTLVVGSGAASSGDIIVNSNAKSLTIGQSANEGFVTSGASGASTLGLTNGSATELLTVHSVIRDNDGLNDIVGDGDDGAVSVNISGGGAGGKVVFDAANTYTGATNIGGGTLQIAGAGSLGAGNYAGAIGIVGGTLQYSSSADQTLTGDVTGTGSLVKDTDAASTLTLTGTNSYGTTLINAGHLQVGDGGSTGTLGSGAVTNNADLIFNLDGTASLATRTVANAIGGTGTLHKQGDSTLILTGTNTYAGTTTVEGGTLQVGDGGTAGTLGAGMVDLAGGTTLAINRSDAYNLFNTLTGAGNFEQRGSGTTTLSGDNSYTGTTSITGGTLRVTTVADGGTQSSLGASTNAASNLVIGDGTLEYAGTGAGSTDRGFQLTGNAGISNASAGTLDMSGVGQYTAGTDGTLTLGGSSTARSTLSGTLTETGAGKLSVDKVGAADTTWRLASANSSYTGSTTVTGGTLQVTVLADGGANSSIGASGSAAGNLVLNADTTLQYVGSGNTTNRDFTLNGSATLAQDGASAGTLTWNGAVANTDANTLTLGGNSGADRIGIMAGVLADGTGTLAITKTGNSTWILTNTNTYSGVTTISGGTLQIGNAGTTGTLGTNVSVVNNGNLAFNRTDDFAVSAVISGGGSVSQNGTGTTTLTGNGTGNTYTGATTVNAGTLQAGVANSAFGVNSTVTVGGVAGSTLDLNGLNQTIGSLNGNANGLVTSSVAGAITLTTGGGNKSGSFAGVIEDGVGSMALTKIGTGTQILSGTNTYSGLTTITAGTLRIGDNGASGTLGTHADVTNNAILQFARTDPLSIAANISGSGSVQNISSGTTTLTGTNDYSGGTIIYNGAISVGSLATNLGSGTLTLGGDSGQYGLGQTTGTLIYTGGGEASNRTINLGGTTGGGAITNNGAGTLTLTGAVNAGGAGSKTLTLNTSLGADIKLEGVISDNSASNKTGITVAGGGTTILTADNLYSGDTTINSGGTLQVGDGTAAGVSSLGFTAHMVNNGDLVLNTTGDFTLLADIEGTGSITQIGGGTVAFSGTSTYAGQTKIKNGTISINTIQDVESATGNALGRPSDAPGGSPGHIAAGTIDLGTDASTGTLKYTGGDGATDRVINLAGGTLTPLPSPAPVAPFGGTLDQSGTGTLAFTSDLTVTGTGAKTFTLTGSTVGTGEFAGAIVDGSGSVGLVKSGTGLWELSNAGNTYSGVAGTDAEDAGNLNNINGTADYHTIVSGGTLKVSADHALGDAGNKTLVNTGATLLLNDVDYATAHELTLHGTGISGGGALSNTGTSTYAGHITIGTAGSGETASINDGGGTLTLTGGITKNGTTLHLTGGGTINVAGSITGTLAHSDVIYDGGGTINLDAANPYNGPTFIRNGTTVNANVAGALPTPTRSHVTMDDSGTGSSVLNLNASQEAASLTSSDATSSITLNANTLTIGATGGTTTFAGVISGTGHIVKDDTSTQVLTGVNTYSGNTTITGGTVQVAGAGSLETGSYGGDIAIGASSTFQYSSSADQTLSGAISGTGNLTKDTNASSLTLSGTSTFAGTTSVTAGSLIVNGTVDASDGVNAVATIASGATLAGNGSFSVGDNSGINTITVNAGGFITAGTTVAEGTAVGANIDILHLTANEVNLNGTYLADINVTAGVGYEADGTFGDVISIDGDVDFTDTLIDLRGNNVVPVQGTHYAIKLLEWTGSDGGTATSDFNAANVTGLQAGQSIVRWGNAYYLVPEPASFALLGLGSLLLLRRPSRRRGRKAGAAPVNGC